MLKTKDQVAKALGEHYSAKFNGKVTCFYDEDEGKFCIQGSKLPSEIYKSGWQLLDHIGPFEAFDILGIEPQTETPAYTLFRHVTAGGAEYLTDNHMFADATLVIRLDGGAELVTCEGMKTETPEVQDRAALADRLEDAIKNPYVWMSANFSEDSFTSKETEKVIQAMREAAAILRGEKPEASGSIGDLVCSTCGGTNIHGLDWVNYNTNEFIGGNESLRDGDRWCEDCQDHPDYFVSPETFKEMQEAKNETP
jgi:hypothetical protein